MNIHRKLQPEVAPYYTDYLSERKDHKRTRQFLDRSLTLLELECGRRELRGEDVDHIRLFIREARNA